MIYKSILMMTILLEGLANEPIAKEVSKIVKFWNMISSEEMIEELLGKLIAVVYILVIGSLASRIIRCVIKKLIFKRAKSRRYQTIFGVLDSLIKYVLYFIIICSVLEVFGVTTSSILAVASVGSVAIGFGAQSLVKDVITGVFILLEEQFIVDDYIEIDGKSGVVESMGLRTTKIRSAEGVSHIIPNGEIKTVSNYSKGFKRAVIDVQIPFDINVDKALAVLRDEMENYEDEEKIIGKPEVLGITDFKSSGLNVRILCDCKPGKSWEVERELRRLVKNRLEIENISIPYTTRTIHIEEYKKS